MSEKILDIKEERLSFFTPAGEVKALNGVSFAMNQGDVLGIVGESGSGKSVTAYSVMGLTAYPGKLVGGTVWFISSAPYSFSTFANSFILSKIIPPKRPQITFYNLLTYI